MAFYVGGLYPNKWTELLEVGRYIPYSKWLTIFGLLLFATNGVMIFIGNKSFEKKLLEMEKEKNLYKAKMYDMQEASMTGSGSTEPTDNPTHDGE